MSSKKLPLETGPLTEWPCKLSIYQIPVGDYMVTVVICMSLRRYVFFIFSE